MKFWFCFLLILLGASLELFSNPFVAQTHIGIGISKYGSVANFNIGGQFNNYYACFKFTRISCPQDEIRGYISDTGILVGKVIKTFQNDYLTIAAGISEVNIHDVRENNFKDRKLLGLPWMIQATLPFLKSSPSSLGLSFAFAGNINDELSYVSFLFGLSLLFKIEEK